MRNLTSLLLTLTVFLAATFAVAADDSLIGSDENLELLADDEELLAQADEPEADVEVDEPPVEIEGDSMPEDSGEIPE